MNFNTTIPLKSLNEYTCDLDADIPTESLENLIYQEMLAVVSSTSPSLRRVTRRIVQEVERVCEKSDRIQKSGQIETWQISLGRHRLNKCLTYYKYGSQKGRIELHSNLSVIVYRYIAPAQSQLGFSGRYNLIEDFLQEFYAESLRAFRRENDVTEDYQPRTRLELAEYMAFTEQYAKRRITLPRGSSQQLIVLRSQTFARRQPSEAVVDIEQAVEFSKGEEGEKYSRSAIMQQVRSLMVSEAIDPSESVLRDRIIDTLFTYFQENGYQDCADYLTLKLNDLSASEIDEILNLTPRQRDYLQQRFKYHIEKFALSSHWKIVHQWLGADLDQKLGLKETQWEQFIQELSPQQQQILTMKQEKKSYQEIAKVVNLTSKKVEKQWTKLLELAWKLRN
jgi:hypothetical protein